MGKRVLVAYASQCGSTGEVAEAIGQALGAAGTAVDVRRAKDVKNLSNYGAVVLGSAVRMGKPMGDAVSFVRRHQIDLTVVPIAYFVVCLTMKDDTPENRQTVAAYLEPLRRFCPPIDEGLFAGKMDFAKLNPLLRWMLTRDKTGQMVEADYRDWDAIKAWAQALGPKLA